MTRARFTLAFLVGPLAVSAFLPACGGDDDPAQPPGSSSGVGSGSKGGSAGAAGSGSVATGGKAGSGGTGGASGSSSGAGGTGGKAGTGGSSAGTGGTSAGEGGSDAGGAGDGGTSAGEGGTSAGSGGSDAGGGGATAGSGGSGGGAAGSTAGCATGKASCGADPKACETDVTLVTSCGACGVVCDSSHAAVKCNATSLVCEIDVAAGGCAVGYDNCDANAQNGCETDVRTDANNCGRCARTCGGAAKCGTGGACEATSVLDPTVSTNFVATLFLPDTVYIITAWGSYSEVRKAPREPGAMVDGTLVGEYNGVSVSAVRGLVADDTNVYWGIEGNPSKVFSAPLAGGAPVEAFASTNGVNFSLLTLQGGAFFFVDNVNQVGAIKTRAKAGPADTVLVPGRKPIGNLQVTDTRLIWTENISASETRLYTAPIAGPGADPTLIQEVAVVTPKTRLFRSGNFIYWNDAAAIPNGRIRKFDWTAPTPTPTDVFIGVASPEGIVVDQTHAYFVTGQKLTRVPLEGGTKLETLSAAIGGLVALYAIDDKYVYGPAGSAPTQRLVRIAK